MPAAVIASKSQEDAKACIKVPSKIVSAPVTTSVPAGAPAPGNAPIKVPSKIASDPVPKNAPAGAPASGVPPSTPSKSPFGGHGGDAEARLEEQIWTGLSSKKKMA